MIDQSSDAYFERIIQPNNRVVIPGTAGDTNVNSTTYIGLDTGIYVPLIGDTLEKVGMQTGWTADPVTQVCARVDDSNGSKLCSVTVGASAWFEDSGAPVFRRSWDGSVWRYTPVGILFGAPANSVAPASTSYYYSPLGGVAMDFTPPLLPLVYAR